MYSQSPRFFFFYSTFFFASFILLNRENHYSSYIINPVIPGKHKEAVSHFGRQSVGDGKGIFTKQKKRKVGQTILKDPP